MCLCVDCNLKKQQKTTFLTAKLLVFVHISSILQPQCSQIKFFSLWLFPLPHPVLRQLLILSLRPWVSPNQPRHHTSVTHTVVMPSLRPESAHLAVQTQTTTATVFAAAVRASSLWFLTVWTVVGVFGMTMVRT